MRFDDRLDTVLKIDPGHESGRITIWRQLVDMLSQSGSAMTEAAVLRCLTALSLLRGDIPLTIRAGSAAAIGSRPGFAPLIALLAHDHPQVAIATVDAAILPDRDWIAILPDLGPVGRSRLRNRADLAPLVLRALAHYGSTDFALSASENTTAVTPARNSDIADLVRRIDTYRHRNEPIAAHKSIAMRCDNEGNIRALQGANRAQFIGISLAEPARPTETGCDAGVARAFGKRAPIRKGRIYLASDSGNGLWQIDADPIFNDNNGRFTGYAGALSTVDGVQSVEANLESARPNAAPMADSMRQLVHELRSPLNAISGFAQLIHGQFFGPVGHGYRGLAEQIIADASHLTAALEDIDLAAMLDAGRMRAMPGTSNMHAVLSRLVDGNATDMPLSEPLVVAVEERELERIIHKLLHAIEPFMGQQAKPSVMLAGSRDGTTASLRLKTAEMLPPSIIHEGVNGIAGAGNDQMLGAGFPLRIVAQMAQLYGGELKIEDNQFILNLPLLNLREGRFDTAI